MNWKVIDKVVGVLAFLSSGFFMIYGVEINSVRWFGFGLFGLILLYTHHKDKEIEKKFAKLGSDE